MADELDLIPMDEAEPVAEEIDGEQPAERTEGAEPQGDVKLFDDENKLSGPVKVGLQKLREADPKVATVVSRAVFRFAEMEREFPGGLPEVLEMRSKLEEFGGFDSIQERLEGAEELTGLADQFMEGNPAFVEDMLESSPESFNALAPIVFQKYAETQPDAFASYIAKIVASDFQKCNLPLMMMRLEDMLGDNAAAREILGQVNGYLAGFQALANKAPAVAPPGPKKAPARTSADQREEQLRSREWNLDRQAVQKTIVGDAYAKAAAGRKASAEERAEIQWRFMNRAKIEADRMFPGWNEKSQRFIRNNDKAGYLRYMTSIYKRIVPEAMASAVQRTLRGKAPGPGIPRGTSQKPGATPVAAAAGFTMLSKEADTWQIDYGRTSPAMLRENRAILKDGKKVQWR